MIRFTAALAAAFFLAAPVSGASYLYQGQDLLCAVPDPACADEPGWTGRLNVAEALLPGGSLASASLSLDVAAASSPGNANFSLFFFGPGGWSIQMWTGPATALGWRQTGLIRITGFLDRFLVPAFGNGTFTWNFGPAGEVISWFGTASSGGGRDPVSSGFGDGYIGAGPLPVSAGPGTWTAILPVPLPASGPLLAATLVLLLVRRRRRRAGSIRA